MYRLTHEQAQRWAKMALEEADCRQAPDVSGLPDMWPSSDAARKAVIAFVEARRDPPAEPAYADAQLPRELQKLDDARLAAARSAWNFAALRGKSRSTALKIALAAARAAKPVPAQNAVTGNNDRDNPARALAAKVDAIVDESFEKLTPRQKGVARTIITAALRSGDTEAEAAKLARQRLRKNVD